MMKGIDTTHKVVYGHEAWITTNKNRYTSGEMITAILRWGHNMRPDGFCQADEFIVTLTDPDGVQTIIQPIECNEEYYKLVARVDKDGAYTLSCVYDNIYAHTAGDDYFPGTRKEYPEAADVVDYIQVNTACFVVGNVKQAKLANLKNIKMRFMPQDVDEPKCGKALSFLLLKDEMPLPHASVLLVSFDGIEYSERMLSTDHSGKLFFVPNISATYCLINRVNLDEAIDDMFESKSVTVTFTFLV